MKKLILSTNIINQKDGILLIIFSLLFFFTFAFNIIPVILLFIILIFFILFLSKKEAFSIIVFSFAFYGVAVIPNFGVFIPYLILIFLMKYFRQIFPLKKNYYSNIFIYLAIIIFISFLLNTQYSDSIYRYIIVLLFIPLLRPIIRDLYITDFIMYLIISLLLSYIIGDLSGRYNESWIYSESANRAIGCLGDPNYFARYILFVISYLTVIVYYTTPLKNKIIYSIFIFILLIPLFGTLSKMGIIILLLIFASYFIIAKMKLSRKLFFISTISIIFILSWSFIGADLFVERMTFYVEAGDISTGRTELQLTGLQKYINSDSLLNLIFGFGPQSSTTLTDSKVLHSIFIEVLIEYGLLFFIAILLLLFHMFKKNFDRPIQLMPYIVFVSSSFALSGIVYWDLVLYYLFFDNIYNHQKIINDFGLIINNKSIKD